MSETPQSARTPRHPSPPPPSEREFTVASAASASWCSAVSCATGSPSAASSCSSLLIVLIAFVGARCCGSTTTSTRRPDNSRRRRWTHPFGTDEVGQDLLGQVHARAPAVAEDRAAGRVDRAPSSARCGARSPATTAARSTRLLMRIADLVLTLPCIAVAAILSHQPSGGAVVSHRARARRAWPGPTSPGSSAAWCSRCASRSTSRRRRRWARGPADHPPAPGAQRARPDHRQRRPSWSPIAILAETGAVLPRLRRAGPGHLAGRCWSTRPSARVQDPAVAVLLPRPVHHPHRADDQLHRRRPARRVRPADRRGCASDRVSELTSPAPTATDDRAGGRRTSPSAFPTRGRRGARRCAGWLHPAPRRGARHRRRVRLGQVGDLDGGHGPAAAAPRRSPARSGSAAQELLGVPTTR